MRRSNCSQVSFTGILAFDGYQSIESLLTRSSPSFSSSLLISNTTSACRTTLVVGMLISTSWLGIAGSSHPSASTVSCRPTRHRASCSAMDTIEFLRPDGLLLTPAFSWVAVIPPGATTIHVGGIDATTADGTLVGEGDIVAQTDQVLANLRVALEAAGASMQDLVSWQLFVVDGVDLTAGY